MSDQIKKQVLTKLYSIGLKTRMLAFWVRTHRPTQDDHSYKEIFVLDLIYGFPPITRKSLGIIFGMSPSSVSDMIRKFMKEGLVSEEASADGDGREKPLVLTEAGQAFLMELKQSQAVRYKYLFDEISAEEWQGLVGLLDKIDAAASRQVDEMIFGK